MVTYAEVSMQTVYLCSFDLNPITLRGAIIFLKGFSCSMRANWMPDGNRVKRALESLYFATYLF